MNIKNYIETAKGKVNNKYIHTLILAIYAGMFIALAGVTSTVVSATIKSYSVAKMLSGLVFPIGLIFVILFKSELFTGNSLLVIPLLDKKIKTKQLLKNWLLVYIGNLIGSIIIAFLISKTPLANILKENFINIANTKISYSFSQSVILGILCNLLVCLAVYLTSISTNITEKVLVIFFPIFMFIALSFEHSVANMFYLSIGHILDNTISIKAILLNNLLPVTIGNIIGGSVLGLSIWYLKKD